MRSLPVQIGPNEIIPAFTVVKPRVVDCYLRFRVPGLAYVVVVIQPSGEVSSISIDGVFKETPVGYCLVEAIRGVRFPPFTGVPQTIKYPFLLR